MGKHAKATRAAMIIRTGACGGAALALGVTGMVAAAPAFADGTPPDEVQSTSPEKKEKKKVVKKVNKNFEYTYNVEQGDDDETHNTNGLLNINDNNVQLILQACNNFVPVNVGGGQVAGEELVGALGLGDEGTSAEAENSKVCEQLSAQQNGDNTFGDDDDDDDDDKFGGAGGGGDETHNTNGLVNINDNNVQIPLQACNNFVPVNVLGVQVVGEELTGALGLFDDGETRAEADNAKDCDQGQAQQDGDNTAGDGNGGGGGGDETHNTNGLVNINDNNVQIPLQACNNNVPVNVLGVQVAGEELTGAAGIDLGGIFGDDDDDDGTSADAGNSKDCDQGSGQQDGDNTGDFGDLAGLIGQQD